MSLVVLSLFSTLASALTLESALYAPDRGTPYTWWEGAREIQSFFTRDYRAAGYIYAYVRNDGNTPVEATDFSLGGKPLDDLRAQHEVIWWRLLPRPLDPGSMAEIMVRLRNPLQAAAVLEVGFSDGSRIAAKVMPEANPIRIETIGFTESLDRVFIVVEALNATPGEVTGVFLDGADVTAQCKLLAPSFLAGISPIALHLDKPLELGSYHVYTVRTSAGEAAWATVRTTDGWVPLGSYGYGTYEEYARNGCNGHANFGRASKGDLDAHARLGMRQVSMLGANAVEPWEVDHPGLYAHYLHDEPDCGDYGFNEIPAHLRIGQLAMEMEARAQRVRTQNPRRPSFLTVDLTYKPANYYIYGPIPDIVNADCYPLSLGADATMVREVVETARLATGPRLLQFTFQGVLEGPRDPEAFAKLRFPRPAFPAEERIMMYYAIGAGARGLFNYIHCTENSETRWSRGSGEFPEIWNEIGLVYRELEHIAPLLALAHPTRLATSQHEKLWLRTLLCGEDAALIIYVNDNYQQLRDSFRHTPLRDVRVFLPDIPWLQGWRAYAVGESGFTPLESGERELRVPTVDVAGAILLTTDPQLPAALEARYRARQQRVATLLLNEWRHDLAEQARWNTTLRTIVGEFGAYKVVGESVGAYGANIPGMWNPLEESYNAFEAGVNEHTEGPEQGARWKVTIPEDHAGQPHILYALCGAWGRPARLSIADPDGATLVELEVSGGWGGELQKVRFTPPAGGDHVISLLQSGRGPRGVRAAHVLFAVPEAEVRDPGLLP